MDEKKEISYTEVLKTVFDENKEKLDFLMKINDIDLNIFYAICLMDQMPLQQLQEYFNQGYTTNDLMNARREYLYKLVKDQDPVLHKVEQDTKLWEQAIDYIKNMQSMLEKQYEKRISVYENLLEKNNQNTERVIEMQRSQIQELKEAADKAPVRQDIAVSIPHQEERKSWFFRKKQKDEKYSEKKEPDSRNGKRIYLTPDEKRFQKEILENEDYDDDQIEYLISCFTEGMTMTQIKRFAYPCLNVTQMQKMNKIIRERNE